MSVSLYFYVSMLLRPNGVRGEREGGGCRKLNKTFVCLAVLAWCPEQVSFKPVRANLSAWHLSLSMLGLGRSDRRDDRGDRRHSDLQLSALHNMPTTGSQVSTTLITTAADRGLLALTFSLSLLSLFLYLFLCLLFLSFSLSLLSLFLYLFLCLLSLSFSLSLLSLFLYLFLCLLSLSFSLSLLSLFLYLFLRLLFLSFSFFLLSPLFLFSLSLFSLSLILLSIALSLSPPLFILSFSLSIPSSLSIRALVVV